MVEISDELFADIERYIKVRCNASSWWNDAWAWDLMKRIEAERKASSPYVRVTTIDGEEKKEYM